MTSSAICQIHVSRDSDPYCNCTKTELLKIMSACDFDKWTKCIMCTLSRFTSVHKKKLHGKVPLYYNFRRKRFCYSVDIFI